ncbi:g11240 [Coccomyxa elongata]
MPDTRATTVNGKRVRAPSGSPPRVSDDEGIISRSDLQRELGVQNEQFLSAVEAMKIEQQQQFEQQEARHRADMQRVKEVVDGLRNEVAQLKAAAESRDRASRASHLIIKGYSEEPDGQSTSQAVSHLFPPSPGEPMPILEARRLEPRSTGALARPRAILVKFISVSAKHAALKHSKALRSRQIYLDSDLTPQQRQLRTQQRDRFLHLKAQGSRPFWRDERLFVNEGGRIREDRVPPPAPPSGGPSTSDGAGPSGAGRTYAHAASQAAMDTA